VKEYLKETLRRFRAAKGIFQKQREAIEDEKRQFNNSIRKTLNFDIGETVLVLKRYVKKGQVKKLTHLWKGPYVVINKFPNQINYEVQLLRSPKEKLVVHASNMKKYTEPHQTHLSKKLENNYRERIQQRFQKEDKDEFEVEEILDKQREDGQLWYLVKWKNYDTDANSWEPIENLIHCRDMLKEFEQKKKDSEERVEPTHL
jgi:hypothetical protein